MLSMTSPLTAVLFAIWLCLVPLSEAIALNIQDEASIKGAARTIADGIFRFYQGNLTTTPDENIGLFPYPPYYWWQSGATWAGMVDYTAYTNDTSFTWTTTQALLAQRGPDANYIVPAHRFDTGNDDQAFWGLGLMSAIENRFPEPFTAASDGITWQVMLQRLFDNQTARWDTTSCGGGLKWQIYPENAYGYNYKNSVSNGAYFQLAARLARFTGDPDGSYVWLATRTWDWCERIGLISNRYDVFDGSDDKLNCTELDHTQWSYNVALFLHGAAALYSQTGQDIWKERLDGLVDAASVFFSPFANATDVMFEAACETYGTCNTDQFSFKAYLARWLGKAMVLAPHIRPRVQPWLEASALAAAKACSGGSDGVTCGHKWYLKGWDGTQGLGQQQSALEMMLSLLAVKNGLPYSLVPHVAGNLTARQSDGCVRSMSWVAIGTMLIAVAACAML